MLNPETIRNQLRKFPSDIYIAFIGLLDLDSSTDPGDLTDIQLGILEKASRNSAFPIY